MARKRISIQLITNNSTRRSTFKKRRASLIKKTSDLSILCGVPACIIVYGPGDPTPEVWPGKEAAAQIISRFNRIPNAETAKRMVDQTGFLSKQLEKLQSQLRQVDEENCRLETAVLLHNVQFGRCAVSDVASIGNVANMVAMVKTRHGEVHRRMMELRSASQSVGPAKPQNTSDMALPADMVGPDVEGDVDSYFDESDFGFDEELMALLSSQF